MALISFHLISRGSRCPGQGSHILNLSTFLPGLFYSLNSQSWVKLGLWWWRKTSANSVAFFRRSQNGQHMKMLESEQREQRVDFYTVSRRQAICPGFYQQLSHLTWGTVCLHAVTYHSERVPECDRGGSRKPKQDLLERPALYVKYWRVHTSAFMCT